MEHGRQIQQLVETHLKDLYKDVPKLEALKKDRKSFIDLGTKLKAISDWHDEQKKSLLANEIFRGVDGSPALDLWKKTDFFKFLRVCKYIDYGYAQATKYISCATKEGQKRLREVDEKTARTLRLDDVNSAAKFAKSKLSVEEYLEEQSEIKNTVTRRRQMFTIGRGNKGVNLAYIPDETGKDGFQNEKAVRIHLLNILREELDV